MRPEPAPAKRFRAFRPSATTATTAKAAKPRPAVRRTHSASRRLPGDKDSQHTAPPRKSRRANQALAPPAETQTRPPPPAPTKCRYRKPLPTEKSRLAPLPQSTTLADKK